MFFNVLQIFTFCFYLHFSQCPSFFGNWVVAVNFPQAANLLTATCAWVCCFACSLTPYQDASFMEHFVKTCFTITSSHGTCFYEASCMKTPWYCFICLLCRTSCLCSCGCPLDLIQQDHSSNRDLLFYGPLSLHPISQTTQLNFCINKGGSPEFHCLSLFLDDFSQSLGL